MRAQLDELGATGTKITVTSDLDEFAIAALAASPVDSYGVGTSVVTGSGTPTAGMVYKLVARQDADGALGRRREGVDRQGVEGRPQGRVPHARARHGDERADRRLGRVRSSSRRAATHPDARALQVPLVVDGEPDAAYEGPAGVEAARAHHARVREELPVRGARAQPVGSGDPDGLRRRRS